VAATDRAQRAEQAVERDRLDARFVGLELDELREVVERAPQVERRVARALDRVVVGRDVLGPRFDRAHQPRHVARDEVRQLVRAPPLARLGLLGQVLRGHVDEIRDSARDALVDHDRPGDHVDVALFAAEERQPARVGELDGLAGQHLLDRGAQAESPQDRMLDQAHARVAADRPSVERGGLRVHADDDRLGVERNDADARR
jgi:hypothetical protein